MIDGVVVGVSIDLWNMVITPTVMQIECTWVGVFAKFY